MNRARLLTIPVLALCAPFGFAQTATKPAQAMTVKALVAAIQAREKAVKTVEIDMTTRGTFPGAMSFETTGTIRVLGTTHFHTKMTVRFGGAGAPGAQGPAEFTSEAETVRTPGGVVMRNEDPAAGEVFIRMPKALLDDLEAASKVIGEAESIAGAEADLAEGPLGSIMLADLDKLFDLEVKGLRLIGAQECYVVEGSRREDVEIQDEVLSEVDRVEIHVRRADMAIVRMTQFDAAVAVTDVQITRLVLDQPMAEASFEMQLPAGATLIDAENHPPHKAQIDRVFAEAAAKGWKRGEGR